MTGGPKAWERIICGKRDTCDVYKVMRDNVANPAKLDAYWKFICEHVACSNYIGDHMETLMCHFQPCAIKKLKPKLRAVPLGAA